MTGKNLQNATVFLAVITHTHLTVSVNQNEKERYHASHKNAPARLWLDLGYNGWTATVIDSLFHRIFPRHEPQLAWNIRRRS
jgi:hypothetical protein